MQCFTRGLNTCKVTACFNSHSASGAEGFWLSCWETSNQFSMTDALAQRPGRFVFLGITWKGSMSGKARQGRRRDEKKRLDGVLADYRARSKDPLYANYCKQVIALVKKGRQKQEPPPQLLMKCSQAAMLTGLLELNGYRCTSWRVGCPVHVSKFDRLATTEGVEVLPTVSGDCLKNEPLMCLKEFLAELGYDPLVRPPNFR